MRAVTANTVVVVVVVVVVIVVISNVPSNDIKASEVITHSEATTHSFSPLLPGLIPMLECPNNELTSSTEAKPETGGWGVGHRMSEHY